MRIIAGQWRSRTLVRPETPRTRPMPDRVKEALFDVLGSRYECPGELPPLRVADVFAGSGSMGLEALSRGASHCWFFERERIALTALRKNIDTLDAVDRTDVITTDAWRSAVRASSAEPFELVFLDPPYRESEDTSQHGQVARFLVRLTQEDDNRPLVVLHHPAKTRFGDDVPASWHIADQRVFGSNGVTLFAR